jgi:hypothetical protein
MTTFTANKCKAASPLRRFTALRSLRTFASWPETEGYTEDNIFKVIKPQDTSEGIHNHAITSLPIPMCRLIQNLSAVVADGVLLLLAGCRRTCVAQGAEYLSDSLLKT